MTLPLSAMHLDTDQTINYGNDQYSVTRGCTYICTANSEAHAKLIVDSVNHLQQYREALRRIERQSRILSESTSPFTINEIAKTALKLGRNAKDEKIAEELNNLQQYREALKKAASTFRKYEELHRAKGTDDALAKAESNAALAEIMETALGRR